MKKFLIILSIFIGYIFVSCGNSSMKIDPNLSIEETNAVDKTQRSLPRGSKLDSYEVLKSKLSLAFLDNEYKNQRDQVNKARLDYQTNMKRGLHQVAQKNLESLQTIQNLIIEKASALTMESPEYLFVLAKVKEKGRQGEKFSDYIAIYDLKNLDLVDLILVTTPLYNNAVMVTEALNGTLADPNQKNQNLKSSDKVVDFILNSNPK